MNNNQSNNQTNQIVMQPPLYFAEDHVWNVCFHPSADVIACSEITGQIQVLKYTSDQVTPLIQNKQVHKLSARYCTFNPTGNLLGSCSEDKRLAFLDGNGKIAHIIKKAHPSPINRCKFISDHIIVSGDDDGLVKVWDLRTVVPIFHAQQQGQAITGIAYDPNVSDFAIYTSCLNGTVAAYDIRQAGDSNNKLMCISDSVDQELAGIQMIKNGRYLASPSSQGSVILYKRQQLQHHADRIQGQPGSVDAIVKIDQNTIVTGSQDGFLRGISVLPNKILYVLGQHQQQQNFPIQSISLSHCKRFMASSSHDNSIKFYDVNQFVHKRSKIQQLPQDIKTQMQLERQESGQSSNLAWQNKNAQNSQDYDSDDSDDDDQSQEMEEQKKKKKKHKKMSIKTRERELKKQNVKSFFKGL